MTDQPKKRASMLDHHPELQFAANARAKALIDAIPMAEPMPAESGFRRLSIPYDVSLMHNREIRHSYRVTSGFYADQIVATTHSVRAGKTEEIARRVVRLQDQAIRAALIDLGWTPPEGCA